ncbi:hypothetical protein PXH59_04935 [Xenorhabdus sp. SF857]|uniref:hypothetical protein n=1 Tax=Xenorhabdus bakwenae TaxID=3026967 RepID=UPI0025580A87|nr:hypothetical protein [Xenorhabdus sp. SF857]WFQ80485.1 hypothetical protein PXH59_04935 [Xenorhabdus sp. SF857]
MSLETSLDKNNALLETNNALLSQLLSTFVTPQTAVAPAANSDIHEADLKTYAMELPEEEVVVEGILAEAVDEAWDSRPAKPKKSSVKKVVDNTPVDIETLDLETVSAIAVLFKNDAYTLTADKLAQARAVIDGVGKARNGQVDALDCALQGLPELKSLTNAVILDLCLEMVASWDEIPGITERREFALALLNEGKHTTEPEPEPEPEVDPAVIFEQARQALLRLSTGGYRREAVSIVQKFGAIKVSDIPPEKLPEVLKMAEAAWVEE